MFSSLHSKKKKKSKQKTPPKPKKNQTNVHVEFSLFQSVSFTSCPFTAYLRGAWLHVLCCLLSGVDYRSNSSSSILFSRLNSPISLKAPPCNTLIISVVLCWTHTSTSMSVLFSAGRPSTEYCRSGSSSAEQKERITSFNLLAALPRAA